MSSQKRRGDRLRFKADKMAELLYGNRYAVWVWYGYWVGSEGGSGYWVGSEDGDGLGVGSGYGDGDGDGSGYGYGYESDISSV
jgi:hypothetical protein